MKRARDDEKDRLMTQWLNATVAQVLEQQTQSTRAKESPEHTAVRISLEALITKALRTRDDFMLAALRAAITGFFEKRQTPLPPGVATWRDFYLVRYADLLLSSEGEVLAVFDDPMHAVVGPDAPPLDLAQTLVIDTSALEDLHAALKDVVIDLTDDRPVIAIDDDDDDAVHPPPQKPRPAIPIAQADDEEEEQEQEPVRKSSKRRRKKKEEKEEAVSDTPPAPRSSAKDRWASKEGEEEKEEEEEEKAREAIAEADVSPFEYDYVRLLEEWFLTKGRELGALAREWDGPDSPADEAFLAVFDTLELEEQLFVLLKAHTWFLGDKQARGDRFLERMLRRVFTARPSPSPPAAPSRAALNILLHTFLSKRREHFEKVREHLDAHESAVAAAKGRGEPEPDMSQANATRLEELVDLSYRQPDLSAARGTSAGGADEKLLGWVPADFPWEWRRYEFGNTLWSALYQTKGHTLFNRYALTEQVMIRQYYLHSLHAEPIPLRTLDVTTTALVPGNGLLSTCWLLPALHSGADGQDRHLIDMLARVGLVADGVLASDGDRRLMGKVGTLIERARDALKLPADYADPAALQARLGRAMAALQLFVAYDQPITPVTPSVPYAHVIAHEPLLYPRFFGNAPFGGSNERLRNLCPALQRVATMGGAAAFVTAMERDVTLTVAIPYVFYLRLYRHMDTLAATHVRNGVFKQASPGFRALHGALSPALVLSDIFLLESGGLAQSGLGHLVFRQLERAAVRSRIHSGFLINFVHGDSLAAMGRRPGYLELSRNEIVKIVPVDDDESAAAAPSEPAWSTGLTQKAKHPASTLYPPKLGANASSATPGHWIWLAPSARFVAVVREMRRVHLHGERSMTFAETLGVYTRDMENADSTVLAVLRQVEQLSDPVAVAQRGTEAARQHTVAFPIAGFTDDGDDDEITATITFGFARNQEANKQRTAYRRSASSSTSPSSSSSAPPSVLLGNEDGDDGPYEVVLREVTLRSRSGSPVDQDWQLLLTYCLAVFMSDTAQLWARRLVLAPSVWKVISPSGAPTLPLAQRISTKLMRPLLLYDYFFDSPDARGSLAHCAAFMRGTADGSCVLEPHARTNYVQYLPEKAAVPAKKKKAPTKQQPPPESSVEEVEEEDEKKDKDRDRTRRKEREDGDEEEEKDDSKDRDYSLSCHRCQLPTDSVFCSSACLHAHYGTVLKPLAATFC